MLTTSLAIEGLFAAVNPFVIVQRGQLLECPAARAADMGLLVTVIEQVLVVGLLERERFPTDAARVRHFSCKLGIIYYVDI